MMRKIELSRVEKKFSVKGPSLGASQQANGHHAPVCCSSLWQRHATPKQLVGCGRHKSAIVQLSIGADYFYAECGLVLTFAFVSQLRRSSVVNLRFTAAEITVLII